MTVSTILMQGECLIVATLTGFSDEALRQELDRRAARRAIAVPLADGQTTQRLMQSCAQQASHAGARTGTAGEELHDVIALADFDSLALIDELGSRPGFQRTMFMASGYCLIDQDAARDLRDAVERQDYACIRDRLLQLLPVPAMVQTPATA